MNKRIQRIFGIAPGGSVFGFAIGGLHGAIVGALLAGIFAWVTYERST